MKNLQWSNLDWQKVVASIILGVFGGLGLLAFISTIPELIELYGKFILGCCILLILLWSLNKFCEIK